MNRDGILIIIAAALLGACGSDATIETGSDLAALKLAASSYHEAATAKDREGVVAFYDRNAIMVPPNDDLVENLEGVQNYRFGFIETPYWKVEKGVVKTLNRKICQVKNYSYHILYTKKYKKKFKHCKSQVLRSRHTPLEHESSSTSGNNTHNGMMMQ